MATITIEDAILSVSNEFTVAQELKITDAGTTTVASPLTLDHDSSGTPGAGFGTGLLFTGKSSTTSGQDMGRIQAVWTTATHASRGTALQFQTLSGGGALTTNMTLDGTGNATIAATLTIGGGTLAAQTKLQVLDATGQIGIFLTPGTAPSTKLTSPQLVLESTYGTDMRRSVRLVGVLAGNGPDSYLVVRLGETVTDCMRVPSTGGIVVRGGGSGISWLTLGYSDLEPGSGTPTLFQVNWQDIVGAGSADLTFVAWSNAQATTRTAWIDRTSSNAWTFERCMNISNAAYTGGLPSGAILNVAKSDNTNYFRYMTDGTFTTRIGGVDVLRQKAGGQLQFVPLASAPSGAAEGDVYMNSTTHKLQVYNGTTWQDLN